jgi:hypothetical protein
MYINKIYVDHVALAWSLADSVRAQRDALESSSHGPARWRAQSTRRTASIGGNPRGRLLRWLRKGGPLVGSTAEPGHVSVTHAPIAFR